MIKDNENILTLRDKLSQLRKRISELEIYEKFYEKILNKIRKNSVDINLINYLNDLIDEGSNVNVISKVFAEHINKIFKAKASVFLLSSDKINLLQQNNPLNGQLTKQINNLIGFKLPYLTIPLKNSKIYSTLIKAGLPNFTNDFDIIQLMIKESISNFKMEDYVQQIHNILEYNSVLTIPLISKYETIGLVEIGRDKSFSENELKRLEIIVNQLTVVIKRALTEKELADNEKKYRSLVEKAGIGMVKDDIHGNLLFFNEKFLQIFEYSQQEMTTKSIQSLIHSDDFMKFNEYRKAVLSGKKTSFTNDFRAIKKNGSVIYIKVEIESIFENGETIGTYSYLWDISYRKSTQEKNNSALLEKDFIIKEINHRVKNNMAVISSLLALQSKTVTDEKALAALKESQNRIRSMSLIHEKLYHSKNLSNINFSDYIKKLAYELFNLYNINADLINLKINIQNVLLGLDYAIPCGLIINELISNSLKYAFVDGKSGEIKIEFTSIENKYVLTFSDNGIGFREEIDFRNTGTMGMQLICTLVDQLDGNMQLLKGKGTVFKITFSITNDD